MIEQKPITRGMDAVFYLVKDMARARKFYEGLLGVRSGMESDYWVEYELPDGSTFALAHDPRSEWKECRGIMFGVPDRQTAIERMKAMGGAVTDTQFESEKCGAAECIDTEGNYLYLHYFK